MDTQEWLKSIIAEDVYFYTALLVLVGVLSFGLGRLSVEDALGTKNEASVVLVQRTAESPLEVATSSDETKKLVGSKNGTKYHLLWCSGAQRINEENKVFFESEGQAQVMGYTAAANCEF
ncbi:MAG: hypothetical protein ACI9H6_000339 [Patiriisocius sp.]|jgi:hypothetical protein